jgi:2'-5' RNA ligase
MEKKRIFAAIDISDETRERIAVYQRSLGQNFHDIPVKWEKPEKLHITLKFAGCIDNAALNSLTSNVAAAAADTQPFSITLAETGAFVKRSSRSNVLWIGSSQRYVLDELAAKIDVQTIRRRLKPHITIARIKDVQKAQPLIDHHLDSEFDPVTFKVKEITIYESTLLPSGSVYGVVSRHRLAGEVTSG